MCEIEQARLADMTGQRFVEQLLTVVAGDVMSPFPKSKVGSKYVLVLQDLFNPSCQWLHDKKGFSGLGRVTLVITGSVIVNTSKPCLPRANKSHKMRELHTEDHDHLFPKGQS